ncbi:HD domain-containing protein [Patescibacteria group bacterium]|nr:HD domain-containing protein [Patescibacteria group bacterium]
MQKVDYFSILKKYIDQSTEAYSMIIAHGALVAAKAYKAAVKLSLTNEQKQFIVEASMLHDIGTIQTEVYSDEKNPYIMHGVLGRKILEDEGLPRHAFVCEHHIGVGIAKEDITDGHLPLPVRDMIPQTIEEEIVAYADKFYSKKPESFYVEKSISDIILQMKKDFGERKAHIFEEWVDRFE